MTLYTCISRQIARLNSKVNLIPPLKHGVRFTRFSCRHVHAPCPFPFEIKRRFTSGVLHQIHFYKIINPALTQNEIRIKKNLSCSRKYEREPVAKLAGRYFVSRDRGTISLVKEFFFSFYSSRRVTSKSQKNRRLSNFRTAAFESQMFRRLAVKFKSVISIIIEPSSTNLFEWPTLPFPLRQLFFLPL